MKLRGLCQGWIRRAIGNGEYTFLWTDKWHPLGASYEKFGEALVVNRGQAFKTKVSTIIDQGVWRWPSQRNRAILNIMRHTPSDFLPSPSTCDGAIWTLSTDGVFSVKTAWEACRHKNPIQPWHSLIWFSQGVPK